MADEKNANVTDALATVVKTPNEYSVVINRGSTHDVSIGDKYLIYCVDPEEILDPETGESLGHLEIVRGTGTVVHLQEKMATVESNKFSQRSKVVKRGRPGSYLAGIASLMGETEEEISSPPEKLPFDNAEKGDRAKPV